MVRRAARIDDNQQALVKLLRQLGCSVACTHTAGAGFPDLVVGYRGVTTLAEVKDPEKSPSRRVLTTDQKRFHAEWRGSIHIIQTPEDAIKLVDWMVKLTPVIMKD